MEAIAVRFFLKYWGVEFLFLIYFIIVVWEHQGGSFVESFEKKTVLNCSLYFKRKKNCLTQLFILLPEFEKSAELLKPIL